MVTIQLWDVRPKLSAPCLATTPESKARPHAKQESSAVPRQGLLRSIRLGSAHPRAPHAFLAKTMTMVPVSTTLFVRTTRHASPLVLRTNVAVADAPRRGPIPAWTDWEQKNGAEPNVMRGRRRVPD